MSALDKKKLDNTGTVIEIIDWNDAVTPGMYYSNPKANNAPVFEVGGGNINGLYGMVFCYGKQVRQVVMPQYGIGCKIRFCGDYEGGTNCSPMPPKRPAV